MESKVDKREACVRCSSSNDYIFQFFYEAIEHTRHETKLRPLLKDIYNDIKYYENKNFEEIIYMIHDICKNINQIGPLMVYDISARICRHYGIIIDNVYIIGGGPKKAIKLLNINPKLHKINKNIKVRHYVTIDELITAFDNSIYELNETMRNNRNGDDWETFICKWAKNKINVPFKSSRV
jgi:hypothetical protein